MAEVVELDNTFTMTPEQALARAGREKYKEVVIIGVNEDGTDIYTCSDTEYGDLYWLLSKARKAVLDGDFE